MRFTTRKLALVLIAFVFAATGAWAAQEASVSGHVLDSEGAAIEKAHIVFHFDHAGQTNPKSMPDIVRETDSNGDFSANLAPGFYDICTMATGFTPQCRKILMPGSGSTQQDFRLSADPLVVSHLGDKF